MVNNIEWLVYLNIFLTLTVIMAYMYEKYYKTKIVKIDQEREIKEELKFTEK